jgi:protein involved in polysaccharide export with SLBB domain
MRARSTFLTSCALCIFSASALIACVPKAPPPPSQPIAPFRSFQTSEPSYRLFPGDTVRLSVLTAPELDRETLLVAPDGRIHVPLAEPIMVAGLSLDEAKRKIEQALSRDLVDPAVSLSGLTYGSQQIFVGGAVRTPGVYALPGEIGVLEAVLLAGGFTIAAEDKSVVVIRRSPGGGAMMRTINIGDGIRSPVFFNADEPLQRFDIIYVPNSTIANIATITQQYLRDALPVQFSLVYDLADITG